MTVSQGVTSSWRVGDAKVTKVEELALAGFEAWLMPDATPEITGPLKPFHVDETGRLLGSVHSFVIELDGLRVVVDTGVGNDKPRALPDWDHLDTPFLDRLTAAGFPPESVDLVLITHLHMDHVGWNTRLVDGAWVPAFPNARYLTSRTEREYWASVELPPARRQMFADSVDPLGDKLETPEVPESGLVVVPGLTLVPAPGHTPGQVAVRVDSAGESGLITGDLVHHPVQLAHPDLGTTADIDPESARRVRWRVFGELSTSDTLLFGTHFADPAVGHVRRDGDAFRFVPGLSRNRIPAG